MVGEEEAIRVMSLKRRREGFHQLILGVGVSDKVDQTCGNDMWQVADRAGDDVVFMIIQYDWKCTQGFYERCVCINLFFRYFGGRGENKVSVLNQDWFGIGKTTLFRNRPSGVLR